MFHGTAGVFGDRNASRGGPVPLERPMFLHSKFSSFSRVVRRLLPSLPVDAALNNMSHGLCMFGPDNRLLLWNDLYVEASRPRSSGLFWRVKARL